MNRRKQSVKEIAAEKGTTPEHVAKGLYGQYVEGREIEKVRNYEKALAASFDGWVLHHLKEAECTAKELVRRKEYFYVPAKDLVWLTEEDHDKLHEELNKLPWRVELDRKRRERISEYMKGRRNFWDEDRKKEQSRKVKEWWTEERRQGLSDKFTEKRENGLNKVNVAQLDGEEGYREYQKQYQRMYYDEHSTEWKNYLTRRRYAALPTEKLVDRLRQKRLSVSLAPERKERLVNFILDELRNRKDVAEHFLYDITLDRDELKEISDKIEESKIENG